VTPARPLIAVVDDDVSVRRALARLLQAAGYGTETFADAEAFLAHLASHPPACLILDVRMPNMSGPELYDHLIAERRAIPTIFITGHGDSTMAARAIKAGAAGFLLKPFEDEQLLNAVRVAVNHGP
jgi:FixJ family two-component response regulator